MNSLVYKFALLAASSALHAAPAAQDVPLDETTLTQWEAPNVSVGRPIPSVERNVEIPDVNIIVKEAGPWPRDALLPGNKEGTYVMTSPEVWSGRMSIKDACWAKVYDEDGLQGDSLILMGPMAIPDMRAGRSAEVQWRDRISDIATDVNAQVVLYDNTGLRDPLVVIQPGQRVNINNAIKSGEIRSLSVNCRKR